MSEAITAARTDLREHDPAAILRAARSAVRPSPASTLRFDLYGDLRAVDELWRGFESNADCTVFQTYDYVAAWHRHLGERAGIRPAIVVVREGADIVALLPLALAGGAVRRLIWCGQEICDYLGPLLAPDFSRRVAPQRFATLWRDILARLQGGAAFAHDVVDLRKMPERIGTQVNPFRRLRVTVHPSNAHQTQLTGNWDDLYQSRRSGSARKRDRYRRKKLAEAGECRAVEPASAADIRATLETLFAQKSDAFARMGVADIFARPGYREFYLDLATHPRTRDIVHVARLDAGSHPAAVSLSFVHRHRYCYVLASYAQGELAAFSPGGILLQELLRIASERRLTEFDFTIGDERYKFEWSDTDSRLYDYLGAATWRGVPAVLAFRAFALLKHTIKQTPALWVAFVQARELLGALRSRLRG